MNYWGIIIDNERSYFERYFELISSTIKVESEKLNTKAEEVGSMVSKGEADGNDADDYLADLAYELSELDELMHRSFVLSVFVFMEDLITQLCKQIQKSANQTFSVKDLGGSGISRSLKYLEKVLGKQFPSDPDLYSRLEVAWKIRNALAHSGGIVEKGNRPVIEAFIAKNPGSLCMSQVGRIEISASYAKSMIELNAEICGEIQKHWREKDTVF